MRSHNWLWGLVILPIVLAAPAYADITPADVPGDLPTSATIKLNDSQDSTFEVSFLGVSGNTWSYRVEEIRGQNLKLWGIGVPSLLFDHLVDTNPLGSVGVESATGFSGITWNVHSSFSAGEFAFTLDRNYRLGVVDVLAKTAPTYGTAQIVGPDILHYPAPGAALLGLVGLSTLAGIRRRLS